MARKTKVKVKVNRWAFGTQVTGAPETMAAVRENAQKVAARAPGAEVEMLRQRVRGGGLRATAHIKKGTDAEEAKSGELLSALSSVSKVTRSKGKR